MLGLTEQVPLRTGIIKTARDWCEYQRIEEPDGTLHAWSRDGHIVLLPDPAGRPSKLTLRTATVKNMLTGRVRLRRMVVAELDGVFLHLLDGQLHFSGTRRTLAAVDAVKTPLPPRDGNTYELAPIRGVRLYITDRKLVLTTQELT